MVACVSSGVSSVTQRVWTRVTRIPFSSKLLWFKLGHSLPALNITLVPACWTLPPKYLNTSDLGSGAGVQISSGYSVSTAVKLAVVFEMRQALFQSCSCGSISMKHFSVLWLGAWYNVCVYFCLAFCWRLYRFTHVACVSWQTSETKRDIIGLFSCYFSPLQEVSC